MTIIHPGHVYKIITLSTLLGNSELLLLLIILEEFIINEIRDTHMNMSVLILCDDIDLVLRHLKPKVKVLL